MDRKDLVDLIKWVIVGVCAIVSFVVIDVGRLNIENAKFEAERRQKLLESYLASTETSDPLVWRRKLQIVSRLGDYDMCAFAVAQLQFIDEHEARNSLYREAVALAGQLIDTQIYGQPEWYQRKSRLNQLYYGELPLARLNNEVRAAMENYFEKLKAAEDHHPSTDGWKDAGMALAELSKTVAKDMPKDSQSALPSAASAAISEQCK